MTRYVVISASRVCRSAMADLLRRFDPSMHSYVVYQDTVKAVVEDVALSLGKSAVTFISHPNYGRGSAEYWQAVCDITDSKFRRLWHVIPPRLRRRDYILLLKRGISTSNLRSEIESTVEFYRYLSESGEEGATVSLVTRWLEIGDLQCVFSGGLPLKTFDLRSTNIVPIAPENFRHLLTYKSKCLVFGRWRKTKRLALRGLCRAWHFCLSDDRNGIAGQIVGKAGSPGGLSPLQRGGDGIVADGSVLSAKRTGRSSSSPWILEGGPVEADLGVVFAEQRAGHVESKSRHLVKLVESSLAKGQRVVVVVPHATKPERLRDVYEKVFAPFCSDENFRIVLIPRGLYKKRLWLRVFALGAYMVFASLLKWRRTASFRALYLSVYARMVYFEHVYESVSVKSWIGFTGYLKLPVFATLARRDRQKEVVVGALQYGVAAKEQKAYKYYKVDKLFAYDRGSIQDFLVAGMQAGGFFASGSLEVESLIDHTGEALPDHGDRLVLTFFDQPVLQRGEFAPDFRERVVHLLCEVASHPSVLLYIKLHPRTSKSDFPVDLQAKDNVVFVENDPELGALVGASHVSMSYFSNLLDVALEAGGRVISMGGNRVFSEDKVTEMRRKGAYVGEDFGEVSRLFAELVGDPQRRREIEESIASFKFERLNRPSPSTVILSELLPGILQQQ